MESFYGALHGEYRVDFPWQAIWKTKVPRNVAFFAWTVAHGNSLKEDSHC